jgi:hypothetical protein
MAIQTRRHKPRVGLKETASLNFLSGIRGVVVDVSEGGLRFKTSSALKNSQSSRFRFTFSGGGEVLADLAWTDESGTTGGLKFRSVSPEVRQQARAWMRQSWETTRGIAGPNTAEALSEQTTHPFKPAVFTETQNVVQTNRGLVAGRSDNQGRPKRGGNETHLSMFPLESTSEIAAPAHPFAGRRRLAIVALIVLFFFGSATAAARYFDPSGTRDVMARAQHIVTLVTIRIRNLPMPRLNRQRLSGAVTQDGNDRLMV